MLLKLNRRYNPAVFQRFDSGPVCDGLLFITKEHVAPHLKRGQGVFRVGINDKRSGLAIALGESHRTVQRAIQNAVDILRVQVDELARERKELQAIIRKVNKFAQREITIELEQETPC